MDRPTFPVDYDGDLAKGYESGRSISGDAAATWYRAVRQYLPVNGPIIDVGAGTGRFTRLLAERAPGRVAAVEPAAGMRSAAIDAAGELSAPLVGGTAEKLPIADGAVAAVWTAFTTHYFHLRATAREFSRILNANGVVMVWHAFEDVFDDLEWYRWFPTARSIDEERMPTFDDVVDDFAAGGLCLRERSVHDMLIAEDLSALADRLAHRSISTLQLIDDQEFARGLERLRAHASAVPRTPVFSPNVLAVFEVA